MNKSVTEIKQLQELAITVLGERSVRSRMVNKNLEDFLKNLEYAATNIR